MRSLHPGRIGGGARLLVLFATYGALTGAHAVSQSQVFVTKGDFAPPVIGHVTIMARGFQSGLGNGNSSITGHVFIEVTEDTVRGPVTQSYGFYPSSTNENLGMIRGPGRLKSEYRCDSCTNASIEKKFGPVRESVDIEMTFRQMQTLFAKIDGWNRKDYQLVDSNCIDFAATAVETLGYSPPPRYPAETPVAFIKALKQAIIDQKSTRAAQDQKKRAKLEEKETIPLGWVLCTCPTDHSAFGAMFNGQRWHPDGVRCPQ